MFDFIFTEEKNIFNFAQKFKEYWSSHSKSISTPSFLIFGKKGSPSCIVFSKNDYEIASIVKLFKVGASIDQVCICVDGNINTEKKDSSFSILFYNDNSFDGKCFDYKCDSDYKITWNDESPINLENKNSWLLIQSIIKSKPEDQDDSAFLNRIGFSEDRQYLHNIRSVYSFVSSKYDLFIIDLISAKHPDWCDASTKMKKLCKYLLVNKLISDECFLQLLETMPLLGTVKFIDGVTSIVKENIKNCDINVIISPEHFAENLQRKIFDFNFDLYKSDFYSW
jgi:hypothetical protein